MTLLQHPGDDGLGADEGAHQVDVHHLPEFLRAHLRHGDAADDARVVEQDVYAAQIGLDLGDQILYLGLIGDVGNVALGVNALGGVIRQSLAQMLLAAAVEGDLRPRVRQGLRHGEADAVGPAGHQGGLALQGKQFLHIHTVFPHFQRSSVMGMLSMSSKAWFSPPMAQMKV